MSASVYLFRMNCFDTMPRMITAVPVGYGAMRLSIQARPSEEQARRVLHAAMDAGMTLIDTADVYCLDDGDIGHNERLIASVVRERPDRDHIQVATKAGLTRPRGTWTSDGRPRHIREACEKSLRALGVDRIFLYQFHAPDPGVPFEKSIEMFAELQREEKVRYVGVSNVNVKQINAASSIVELASVQNRFSIYFREPLEDGVIDECERRGITFLAYSPLGGGRLAKRAGKDPLLTGIGQRHHVSPHALCLAWLRAKSRAVVPIPGPTRLESVAACAASATVVLTPEEVAAIDDAEFSRA